MSQQLTLIELGSAEVAVGLADSCADTDPECPHCGGRCTNEASVILRRIDMEDLTGTPFCDPCAEDALASGVFRSSGL